MQLEWKMRFLGLAAHVAGWSKDPGTQCGAVIVRPNKTISSLGFNGFPQGIQDDPTLLEDRQAKLDRVVHAEMNALLFLPERGGGLWMFVWPWLSCHRCAVHIVQAGISTVVAPQNVPQRWEQSVALSRKLFKEAGIVAEEIDCEQTIADGKLHGTWSSWLGDVPVGRSGRSGNPPEYEL